MGEDVAPITAALLTLAGTLVGSLGGAVAAVLAYKQGNRSLKAENTRHLMTLAFDLGAKEYESLKEEANEKGFAVLPPFMSAWQTWFLLDLASKGDLNEESYLHMMENQRSLKDAMDRWGEADRKAAKAKMKPSQSKQP